MRGKLAAASSVQVFDEWASASICNVTAVRD
jgi:hypothetical protein